MYPARTGHNAWRRGHHAVDRDQNTARFIALHGASPSLEDPRRAPADRLQPVLGPRVGALRRGGKPLRIEWRAVLISGAVFSRVRRSWEPGLGTERLPRSVHD